MIKDKFPRVWGFTAHLLDEFSEAGCPQRAAALTYMTLFAIVPMLMVIYSAFSIVPAFQGYGSQLQDFLFTHLMPQSGSEIQDYLTDFSSQARSLTGWGVAMLVVTAYLMLKNIEKTFNAIWGVTEARKGLSNFLLYWAVLSLGPLLLGVGLAMSTYLLSLRLFMGEYDSLGVLPFVLEFAPWLLTAAAFTLLFAAVPNCKVPLRYAFVGGLITAICFELFKSLFGWLVANSSFKAIYGAFAMVPLFLLWINILWVIVLAGAVMVKTLSTYKNRHAGNSHTDFIAALLVLRVFSENHKGGGALNDGQFQQAGLDSDQWQKLRTKLLDHKVIAVTQQGEYVLCRDLRYFTLNQLNDMLMTASTLPKAHDGLQNISWFPEVQKRLSAIDGFNSDQLDVSLAEIFDCKAALTSVNKESLTP